jgi:hypothetical protein
MRSRGDEVFARLQIAITTTPKKRVTADAKSGRGITGAKPLTLVNLIRVKHDGGLQSLVPAITRGTGGLT